MNPDELELKRRFEEEFKMMIIFYTGKTAPELIPTNSKSKVVAEMVPFYPTLGKKDVLKYIDLRIEKLKEI